MRFNAIGELDGIDIDLGLVISARAKLDYERNAWFGEATNAQPQRSKNVAIIEYAAHPQAKLYLQNENGEQLAYDLSGLKGAALEVAEARQLVRVRVVDEGGTRGACADSLSRRAG